MTPPLVSYITFNRLGLTARNLPMLLKSPADFEIHLVDSHSQDDTWEYIRTLKDPRIKLRTKLQANRGPIYALNYTLSKRKPDQYFISIDNDVNIHTREWIDIFLKAFELFPEAGLLGAVSQEYYSKYKQTLIQHKKDNRTYLQVLKGFVEGCCQCIRPEVFNCLGYWNEENCMGDMEICYRINHFTPYKIGFVPDIEIDQVQAIPCEDCTLTDFCTQCKTGETCFDIYRNSYSNPLFRKQHGWKYHSYLKEVKERKREAFCPSIHDEWSRRGHIYQKKMAEENFQFYRGQA